LYPLAVISITTIIIITKAAASSVLYRFIVFVLLLIPILLGISKISNFDLQGFKKVETIVSNLELNEVKGNIIYFGEYRQPFVFYIRKFDSNKRIFILRGDDTFQQEPNIDSFCYKFRIKYLLFESPEQMTSVPFSEIESLAANCKNIDFLTRKNFYVYKNNIGTNVYEFTGKIAARMAPIVLSSKLITTPAQSVSIP
jgi:hypothetical protein